MQGVDKMDYNVTKHEIDAIVEGLSQGDGSPGFDGFENDANELLNSGVLKLPQEERDRLVKALVRGLMGMPVPRPTEEVAEAMASSDEVEMLRAMDDSLRLPEAEAIICRGIVGESRTRAIAGYDARAPLQTATKAANAILINTITTAAEAVMDERDTELRERLIKELMTGLMKIGDFDTKRALNALATISIRSANRALRASDNVLSDMLAVAGTVVDIQKGKCGLEMENSAKSEYARVAQAALLKLAVPQMLVLETVVKEAGMELDRMNAGVRTRYDGAKLAKTFSKVMYDAAVMCSALQLFACDESLETLRRMESQLGGAEKALRKTRFMNDAALSEACVEAYYMKAVRAMDAAGSAVADVAAGMEKKAETEFLAAMSGIIGDGFVGGIACSANSVLMGADSDADEVRAAILQLVSYSAGKMDAERGRMPESGRERLDGLVLKALKHAAMAGTDENRIAAVRGLSHSDEGIVERVLNHVAKTTAIVSPEVAAAACEALQEIEDRKYPRTERVRLPQPLAHGAGHAPQKSPDGNGRRRLTC